MHLSTHWDDELCYLLSPALAAYETEALLGCDFGNAEFQQAIKGHVRVVVGGKVGMNRLTVRREWCIGEERECETLQCVTT